MQPWMHEVSTAHWLATGHALFRGKLLGMDL